MSSVVRTSLICLVLAAVCASSVQAQKSDDRVRYKWRDEAGNLHYSDSMPTEAVRLGYELVNRQGVVVRRVERAKTPEELAAAKIEAERVAAEKRKAEQTSQNDAQMLAAYPAEEDLRRSLQAQIDLINQNIQATEVGIASQEKSLAERLAHAAEQERNGKPVPLAVQKQIATLRTGLTEQKTFLEKRTADRAAMEQQLLADLVRYRELKRKQTELRSGNASR